MWGDGGPGFGLRADFDRIYGGQGNDDLIGGQGQNELVVWSFHPDRGLGELQFEDGQTATAVTGTATLIGRLPLPASGRLDHDARFQLTGDVVYTYFVTVAANPSNETRQDLVDDVNAALVAAGLEGYISASLVGDRLALVALAGSVVINRVEDFGVFVDAMGGLQSDSGDHSGAFDVQGNSVPNGILDIDNPIFGPKRVAYRLEDTGLNRTLGSDNTSAIHGVQPRASVLRPS